MILTPYTQPWSEAVALSMAAAGCAHALINDPSGAFGKGDVLRVTRIERQNPKVT
jgi:hypothetical protein